MATSNAAFYFGILDKELKRRQATCDSAWAADELLMRNTGSGFKNGNVAKEYLGKIVERMFLQEWGAKVRAGDVTFSAQAEQAEVVANEVIRCTKFLEQLILAVFDSSWATTGWLEVGHPMAQYPADLRRAVIAPRVDNRDVTPTTGEFVDEFQEVGALPAGVDPSLVPPVDPFAPIPLAPPAPQPLVQTDLGFPWVVRVDPRYVVTNVRARTWEQVSWVARLRPMTVAEMAFITGRSKTELLPQSGISQMRDLFELVEGEDARDYDGDVSFMVEMWVMRDRVDPLRSDWLYCFPFGRPDVVLFDGPNPHGAGFLPLAPIKPEMLKAYYDKSMAEELRILADAMDAGVKSILDAIERSLNKKYLTGRGAGLTDPEAKHLGDPRYKGGVACDDPTQVKAYEEQPFDQALLMMLGWIRGVAQSTSSQSDLDRGTPIKNISARQTAALMDSSGLSVDSMKKGIGDSAVQALMKMMYLMGRYAMQGYSREFQWGGRTVTMDRGTHDFTGSFIYAVRFGDTQQMSAEQVLMWNQLMKVILQDTNNVFAPFIDLERFLQRTLEKYGEGTDLLASRGANRPGSGLGQAPEAGVDPSLSGSSGFALTGPGGRDTGSASSSGMGEHPEREMGSRGASGAQTASNAMEGMRRTGGGS